MKVLCEGNQISYNNLTKKTSALIPNFCPIFCTLSLTLHCVEKKLKLTNSRTFLSTSDSNYLVNCILFPECKTIEINQYIFLIKFMKRFCFNYLKFIVSSSLPRFLNCVDKLHSLLVTLVGLASLKINRIKNDKNTILVTLQ